jgi:preprotein translocase subunit SecE
MIKKVMQFGYDVKFEMNKVSWPNWSDLKGSTYIVLILSLILTVFLFIIDFFLSNIISTIM